MSIAQIPSGTRRIDLEIQLEKAGFALIDAETVRARARAVRRLEVAAQTLRRFDQRLDDLLETAELATEISTMSKAAPGDPDYEDAYQAWAAYAKAAGLHQPERD